LKKRSDGNRSKTRVIIGVALHSWRQLPKSKLMKFDAELASFDW